MPISLRRCSSLLIIPALAVALSACSSNPSPSPSSSSTTTTTTTTSTSSSSSTQTTGTLAPQTSTGTEFFSPSKNISCEIDSNFGPSALTSALCLTISPPKSVTLDTAGSLTECIGEQCLSNAGENTPTLGYGMSITLGPFTCASSTAGITCTLGNGDGFRISSTAVTPLGSSTLALATTTTTTSG